MLNTHCKWFRRLVALYPSQGSKWGWPVSWIILLPFLKMGVTPAFFHSPGMSPKPHDVSETVKRGLTVTSASTLSTHVCLPSGPMVVHLLNCAPTWFSYTKVKSSLLHPCPCLKGLGLLKAGLPSKGTVEERHFCIPLGYIWERK